MRLRQVSPGGPPCTDAVDPAPFVVLFEIAALAGAVAVAVLSADSANWDLALLASLLAFSIVSDISRGDHVGCGEDLRAASCRWCSRWSSSAARPRPLIGVVTIIVGWVRWRDTWSGLLNNLVAYAWFPLAGGLVFTAVSSEPG